MTFCVNNTEQKQIVTRLNRIEGQVRGINKMLAENRDCIEVLNQIASTQSALKGVWLEVMRGHLKNCVKQGFSSGKDYADLADEVMTHIAKIK